MEKKKYLNLDVITIDLEGKVNIYSIYLKALCLKCGPGIQPNFNTITNMLCMSKAKTTQGS